MKFRGRCPGGGARVRVLAIYATMPVGEVLCEEPKDLWQRTKGASDITRELPEQALSRRNVREAAAVRRAGRAALRWAHSGYR